MTDTTLTAAEWAFAGLARTATLATIAPDGRPRLVPICFVLADGAGDGPAHLYSPLDDKPKRNADPRTLGRIRDVLARPAATVLVDRWSEDWTRLAWLRLDGRAALLEPGAGQRDEHAAAVAALRAKYRQYETHALETRPLIRLAIERAVSWGDLASD